MVNTSQTGGKQIVSTSQTGGKQIENTSQTDGKQIAEGNADKLNATTGQYDH